MLRNLFGGLFCMILGILVSGCAMRTYSQVKDRVDQEDTGNAGYVMGTKQPTDRSNFKKTRRVYVLEIEKKDKNINKVEAKPSSASSSMPTEHRMESMEENAPAPMPAESMTGETGAGGYQEYTVQEGDTLQKISKKFYDTYRKWEKIYGANKDTIKNPDRIKPGTVLMIPKE